MDGNSGAGARPKPRPLGSTAAKASLWCLAPALLILVFGAYLSGSILDLSWLRLSSITIVLAAAIAGILLSATALVAPGGVKRQAILWLVVCGVVGNSLCIVDIGAWAVAERGRTRQIARMRADRALGRQAPRPYADLTVQTALSAAETRYTNAQKQLKHFAATGDGESARFAEACSHMLDKEHKLMEAYAAAAKPVREGHLLIMSNVTEQAEIVRRKRMVEQMLAAAREADVFFKNMESSVREELAQQGVSGSSIERGLQTISAKVGGPRERMGEIAPLRDRWAQDEIGALDLLNTNWGKWTYHVETGKLKFRNSYQAAEFNRLVRDINQMQEAIVKLQAGFQQQQ